MLGPSFLKKRTALDVESQVLTLYTDASFCPFTGAAGGGLWFKHRDTAHQFSFNIEADSPHNAELITAIKSLEQVLEYLDDVPSVSVPKLIVVAVDCFHVKNCFEGVLKNKQYQTHLNHLLRAIKKRSIVLNINHVKAHLPKKNHTPREHVNDICDGLAKKAMRKQRKLIHKQRAIYAKAQEAAQKAIIDMNVKGGSKAFIKAIDAEDESSD